MKSKYHLLLAICFLFYSCNENKTGFDISLDSQIKLDTIYISELITEKLIAKIFNKNEVKTVQLHYPIVANVHTKNNDNQYLVILTPNKDLHISVLPDSSLTTYDKSDSLVNYLWKSNNQFISQNSSFIFQTEMVDSIPTLFEKFRNKRENEINEHKVHFSPEITDILYFQNNARIYSFLFWLGRVSKGLNPHDSYFDFIAKIPEATETLKSLPDIYLYKYEIEYLRKNQTIENIPDFLDFIEERNLGFDFDSIFD
jgi:hypothetical protein